MKGRGEPSIYAPYYVHFISTYIIIGISYPRKTKTKLRCEIKGRKGAMLVQSQCQESSQGTFYSFTLLDTNISKNTEPKPYDSQI